jgi:hypothetical protein
MAADRLFRAPEQAAAERALALRRQLQAAQAELDVLDGGRSDLEQLIGRGLSPSALPRAVGFAVGYLTAFFGLAWLLIWFL